MKRHQTGIKRGDDGRYSPWCRICPRRAWRFLRKDERTGVWFDTAQEAGDQAKRHRKSEMHLDTVERLASTTHEDIVLSRIFGDEPKGPCGDCGFHHSPKLDCVTAARVRDKELPK